MKTASLTLLVALLAGCATPAPPVDYSTMDPGSIAAASVVTGSKFDAGATIEAPAMRSKVLKQRADVDAFSRYDDRMVLLRAVRKPGSVLHQAYVEIGYTAERWRTYQSASFVGGSQTPVVVIEQKVVRCNSGGTCDYQETVGVPLTEGMLRAGGDIEFRLNTRTAGEDVVTLPRNYIDGYLAAVGRK